MIDSPKTGRHFNSQRRHKEAKLYKLFNDPIRVTSISMLHERNKTRKPKREKMTKSIYAHIYKKNTKSMFAYLLSYLQMLDER